MAWNRLYFGNSLLVAGLATMALGVLLLLIKLLMTVAWYASGAILVVGAVAAGAGALLRRRWGGPL